MMEQDNIFFGCGCVEWYDGTIDYCEEHDPLIADDPEKQLIRQAEGSTLPAEDNPEGEETVR